MILRDKVALIYGAGGGIGGALFCKRVRALAPFEPVVCDVAYVHHV